ncbi:MAG: hypothetical protein ACI4EU_10460 [Butyrivibrio sp.]
MKVFSGFTKKTAQSLVLDAGAFFKDFDIENDDFEKAVASGKLIGATKDGGEFSAVPTVRQIEVDGVKGRAKGLEIIDSWDVYLKANVIEIKKETIQTALCASKIADESPSGYTHITANNSIELDDYIDNITWVGTLSGSDKPIIIQVKNALNTDGLKLTTKDKDQSVISMTFYGHYEQGDLNTPPFDIYYPEVSDSDATVTTSTTNEEAAE